MHIITHLDLGGAEGVAMQLIEGLAGEVDAILFAVLRDKTLSPIGADMAARAKRLGVPVVFGTGRGFKSGGVILAALALARAVRRARPDMLHVHTEIPELTLAVACVLSPRVARTALLRTVHNSVLWIAWSRIGQWVTRRLAHGRAVAVSQAAAQADAAIEAGVKRPLAEVIYNAVLPPPIAAQREAPSPVRLLFAGRLVEQKGADLLPAILKQASALASRRDVEVIVAGEGTLHADLAQSFKAFDSPWRVSMVPPIAQLAQHLGDYDAVLLPSRFEGFGLLHLEVLMAGLPLLTCRAPGLAEVLPETYPLATAPGDTQALAQALAALVDNLPAQRQTIAVYRPALVERFAPQRMLAAYLQRYRQLAGACA
ncbi:glycosyltransferase family 4 protein [Novosphingobium terrae]|uniref:glycosyltransferase family 4 protein n=1 Tax=Novosphingobium terrae TaxID=2726189 RepID=UPI00197F3BE5|nr:glycosyltransferase family 4 protein [Novosphingobium terrae]